MKIEQKSKKNREVAIANEADPKATRIIGRRLGSPQNYRHVDFEYWVDADAYDPKVIDLRYNVFLKIFDILDKNLFTPLVVTNVLYGNVTHKFPWAAVDLSPVGLSVPKSPFFRVAGPRLRLKVPFLHNFLLLGPSLKLEFQTNELKIENRSFVLVVLVEDTAVHLLLADSVNTQTPPVKVLGSTKLVEKTLVLEVPIKIALQDTKEGQLLYKFSKDKF